jgi:hypothetical protein
MGTDKGVGPDILSCAVVVSQLVISRVPLNLNLIPHLFSKLYVCFEAGKKAKMKSKQLLRVSIFLIH